MGKFIDLTGQKFGRLTVKSKLPQENGQKIIYWLCDCDCGTKNIKIRGYSLRNGHTKSCGCLNIEKTIERNHLKRKVNKYDLTHDYGIGYTSKNEPFYFDLEDYDKIKDYCWMYDGYGYVVDRNNLKQHRLIMNEYNPEIEIDHINHNISDNRKINLRRANRSDNQSNSKLSKNNTSQCKGVSYRKDVGKWRSVLIRNNIRYELGSYLKKEDAVKARKEAEEKLCHEWSYDNSMKIAKEYELKGEYTYGIWKEK